MTWSREASLKGAAASAAARRARARSKFVSKQSVALKVRSRGVAFLPTERDFHLAAPKSRGMLAKALRAWHSGGKSIIGPMNAVRMAHRSTQMRNQLRTSGWERRHFGGFQFQAEASGRGRASHFAAVLGAAAKASKKK